MKNPITIENLIKTGEGENLEFKSSFNTELIETLVAFANTSGGKIVIGINQNNNPTGVRINSESIQNWVNEIKLNIQKWQYPLEAIREIISNMVIHRDYRSASDSIVKIFDERIEFYNPGRLPESITVNDLLSNNYKSTPRNKLIADFCKSIGLIEKYGSGIQRIMKYFSESNLPLPEFRNISDGFMVTVFIAKKRKVTDKVTDNQTEKIDVTKDVTKEIRLKNILILINEKHDITIGELSQKCGVSMRTINRDITILHSRKLLKRIGDKRNGYWEIQLQQTN